MLNSLHSWGRLRTSDHFASASWLSGMTGLNHQTRKKNFSTWTCGYEMASSSWQACEVEFSLSYFTQEETEVPKSWMIILNHMDGQTKNWIRSFWIHYYYTEFPLSSKRGKDSGSNSIHIVEKKACRDHIVQDGYMVMICPANKSCSSTVEFIVPPGCQSMGHTFKSVTCLLESSRCSSVLESFISGGRSCPMWTGHLCCLQWPVASHHMSLLRVAGIGGH